MVLNLRISRARTMLYRQCLNLGFFCEYIRILRYLYVPIKLQNR